MALSEEERKKLEDWLAGRMGAPSPQSSRPGLAPYNELNGIIGVPRIAPSHPSQPQVQARQAPSYSRAARQPSIDVSEAAPNPEVSSFRPIAPPAAAQPPVDAPAPENPDADIIRAQELAGRGALGAGLSRAGEVIARAIAGGPQQIDESPYEAMRQESQRPMANALQRRQEIEKRLAAKFGQQSKTQELALRHEELDRKAKHDDLEAKRQAGKDTFDQAAKVRELQLRAQQIAATAALTGKRISMQEALMSAREEDKQQRTDDKAVERAGHELDFIPKMDADLRTIQGQIDAAGEDGDIAGAGWWDSKKPEWMRSQADTDVTQSSARLLNAIIKEQTGVSANPAELERIMTSRGMGPGATEQSFKAGFKSLVRDAQSIAHQKEARFRPDVVQQFRERGGVGSQDLPKPVGQASGQSTGVFAKDPKTGERLPVDNATEAELFKAQGWVLE